LAVDNIMDTIDREDPKMAMAQGHHPTAAEAVTAGSHTDALDPTAAKRRHPILRWLRHDIAYIAMLVLALTGVMLRLPVIYWVILTPVFAVISIAGGWSHFASRDERLGLIFRLALDWSALLVAVDLLYNSGVEGVMNANSISLAMMTLLALGTFVAGVQARVWQIVAVGGVLFMTVPSLGWLAQSPLLFTAASLVIILLSSLAWWVSQGSDMSAGKSVSDRGPP
jgi:hypothetical protein